MYKHATCLTLLALLAASSSADRKPRSLWPFASSPTTTEEPLISEKHAEILRQAGYGEYLDLSKHPLWKIHKYEGIDLKPVEVEAEIIKSADARNPVSGVAPLTEQPADLSFLDNLGGLAYFLPEAEDEEETEKADILAGAIANEEQSHPGFFGKLWGKLWGSSKTDAASAEVLSDDSALLQIALPATKENYAEIRLVQPASRQLVDVQPTANQAHQYAFTAGAVQAAKPVDKWYKPAGHFSRSQAWVQSWNPSAAYNVHIQGPSEYPDQHVATVQAYTADPGNQFQRKVSKDEEVVVDQTSAPTPNAEVQNLAQISVSEEEEEKKEVAAVNKDAEITVADGEKKDNDSVNIHAETSVPKDEKTSDNDSPAASVSEAEKKIEPVVVVVAEGQGQEVAGELESSSVAVSPARANSMRQKAVSALKMGIVPARFLKQLNISEREIDDFVNNRESSNKTWEKIRNHLHQLMPRFPAVRRMFNV